MDVVEEEATCASLLGSPPLAVTRMVLQRPRRALGRRQAKDTVRPRQDSFRQGWRSPTTEMFRETGERSVRSEKSEVSNSGEGFHVNSSWDDQLRK